MCQQSPLTILVACIGLLLFCCLPLHGQNTFHKYDHWRYRVATSFHPPAYNYTDRIYDITVLAADKHHALLSCTLLYADDSTENLWGRYHFVSSNPATWTAWDSDVMETMALLNQPVILNVTDHEWLGKIDGIVVVDQHRKTATYSTHIVNAHLLPIDTTLPSTDTALLRQRILKSPWHHHALLYHYPTKVLMHPAGKMVALQAIKRDDVILQVCKATAIQLSKQQPERNTTDKTAHEKTDLIIGCGVYAHHRLQSTDTAKRSCPYHQHTGC
ncbi:hypothetical protein ACTJJB_16420 [Chitinophaga sp. 22536]|uniref:hypothetical protein n=1 Tax=unclassified Chitinophaga TaxID=2619133 RepID=UPI003F86B21C